MRSQTVIPFAAVRIECSHCGAEGRASCNCGVAYMPKKERAREALKVNPEKSDRAIAAEIGVSHPTVAKARRETTGNDLPVDERIGLDGKTRKVPEPKAPENLKVYSSNGKNVFLMNCAASKQAAVYDGPLDNEILTAARRVADAWKQLADDMEKRK